MKLFDTLLLDLILAGTPLAIYLLYIAYAKTLSKKEGDLLITMTAFSSQYLILKYAKSLYPGIPFIVINTPLLLAYLKKSTPTIIITSIIMVLYYYNFYHKYLIILILEYIAYYIFYKKSRSTLKISTFILIFSIVKTLMTIILLNAYQEIIHIKEILIVGLCLYLISNFLIYLLNKTEEILKLHLTIKQLENDKQIKTSLFRITHEIKNPIAVCKGYLDMFDKENQEHYQKYIPILKDEINRTLLLLEDFLAMNRVKINKDIIDINLLIEEVIKSMDMLCKKNHIKIINNIIDDEIYINADYNRLNQVFVNIIKNSIEAMDKTKKGKIEISESITDKKISIIIKDNGKGINKETLCKIKEPFYTTKKKGTGLGVSLSNEIIAAHDGTLDYTSKENEYTKVIITLPKEEYQV